MTSVICTLFEGDYHYGVGALANSLYANGFRGTIYIGYRGALPPWTAQEASEIRNIESACRGEGLTSFRPAEGLEMRFIPLSTKIHLTNFKPDFMLELWGKHCPEAEAMFYFDPDIVIKCRWGFFEEWVEGGVALCEDTNSPMPSSHPIRNAWRVYYSQFGKILANPLEIYVNGGFVGLTFKNRAFLAEWDEIQRQMSPAAGNMMGWGLRDRTFKFSMTDQDALNISLMETKCPFSLSGKEGMDLGRFGYMMSHAIGSRKPWRANYLWQRLSKGMGPGITDKLFWSNITNPIKVTSAWARRWRKLDLLAASAIERLF